MADNQPKLLAPRELPDLGILQEANRLFFHPLGLALMVTWDRENPEDDGELSILDSRDDPEGFVFTDLTEEEAYRKHHSVLDLAKKFEPARSVLFEPDVAPGLYVQPIGTKVGQ